MEIAGIDVSIEQKMVSVKTLEDGKREETPIGSVFRRKGTIVEHGASPRRKDGKKIRKSNRISKHNRAGGK